MSSSNNLTYQKEYLKKYMNEGVKKKKKKKSVNNPSLIKRSKIIDDDIDLKSMRPLDDDELELLQMNEDAPQIAGIIDERPAEVKAQEYYNSKRWKVFGGDDGVNVVDSLDKTQQIVSGISSETSKDLKRAEDNIKVKNLVGIDEIGRGDNDSNKNQLKKDSMQKAKRSASSDSDVSPPRNNKISLAKEKNDSDHSPLRREIISKHTKPVSDSDASPPRKLVRDSDPSPPRRKTTLKHSKHYSNSEVSPPRRYETDSDPSPPRRQTTATHLKHESNYDASSSRRHDKKLKDEYNSGNLHSRKSKGSLISKSDSDNSPPRKNKRSNHHTSGSDSDASLPRKQEAKKPVLDKYNKSKKGRELSSESDSSPPRRDRKTSPKRNERKQLYTSKSPPKFSLLGPRTSKTQSTRLSRKDLMYVKNVKRRFSDSDDSPPRRRSSSFHQNKNTSDLSPPRKYPALNNENTRKKKMYKPNDSSSDETTKYKSKKMKTTLDGKQAGLQDAKQLRKELSDMRMKEDLMFSKMDASVSGVGATAIKRDRKTGEVRDLEKEKEAQKERDAKALVVNNKYSKWGKGLKQVEDAKQRAAEALKEMNKPLARHVDDEDLENFLKAQEREGDPMLDFIKQKQKEATPLAGEKPIYKGSYNPNRFGIRPGHRWDGVVRSSGYEKEWFTHQNARKARDEEAYKWSTSDM